MDDIVVVAIFIIGGSLCWLFGAGGGFYAGYRQAQKDRTAGGQHELV